MPINPRDSDESSDSAGYYVDKPENKRPLRGIGGANAVVRGSAAVVRGRGDRYSDSSDDGQQPPVVSRGRGAAGNYTGRGGGYSNQTNQGDFGRDEDFHSARGKQAENYRDKYRGPVRGGEREYQQQQNQRGGGRNQKVLASSSDEEDKRRAQQQKTQKFDNLIQYQNRRVEEAQASNRFEKERSRNRNKKNSWNPYEGNDRRNYKDQDDEEPENDFDPEVYKAEQKMYADQDRNRKKKDYDSMFHEPGTKSGNQGANKIPTRSYYADGSRTSQPNQPQVDMSCSDYDHFAKNLPRETGSQQMHEDTLILEGLELANELGIQSSNNRGQRQNDDGRDRRDRTPPRNQPSGRVARGGGYQQDRRDPSPRPARYDEDYEGEDAYPRYGEALGGREAYIDYSSSDSEQERRRREEKQALMNQNVASINNPRKRGEKSQRNENNPNLAKRRPRNPEEPDLDERMRILTSFKDFQAPKQAGRVYLPQMIGIASHFEYQGRVIEGTKHYIRGKQPDDSERQHIPRQGEIIKFEAAKPLPFEHTDQYEAMANKLKEMHMSYYKNFEESKLSS